MAASRMRAVMRQGVRVMGKWYRHPGLRNLVGQRVQVYGVKDSDAITIVAEDGRVFKSLRPVGSSSGAMPGQAGVRSF
ncbi:Mu transposase C-terminal domain-containing protein [Kordiimonas lipolytica]|uniref:Mu transposase C-terminal domain-containing protein n=1 Tax=Kordiimonas lipolytica TaxID=1662421 RepID=A0ABV8U9T1_9PROT